MCLMGQNLNWFKTYDTKCTLRLCKILAKLEIDHQNLYLINSQLRTISGHFCANYIKIFHKMFRLSFWVAEQVWIMIGTTVMTQNVNKTQNCNKHKCIFFYNITKKENICILSHNFSINQGLDLVITSKWLSEPQFCEIY